MIKKTIVLFGLFSLVSCTGAQLVLEKDPSPDATTEQNAVNGSSAPNSSPTGAITPASSVSTAPVTSVSSSPSSNSVSNGQNSAPVIITTPTPITPSITPTPATTANPVSKNGLIAFFPFNGNAGDESGNSVNTTIQGAILTKDRFGNADKAYTFDGVSNFIKADIDINSATYPNLTITAWARSSSQSISAAQKSILMVVSQDNAGYDRSLGIDYRGGGFGWSAFAGSGMVLGYQPIETNKWTFLAVIYNQTNKTVDLFVNQNKISKSSSETGTGSSFIRIGSNPGFGQYFQGDIDQVRIYNRSLSDNEIMDIYNAAE